MMMILFTFSLSLLLLLSAFNLFISYWVLRITLNRALSLKKNSLSYVTAFDLLWNAYEVKIRDRILPISLMWKLSQWEIASNHNVSRIQFLTRRVTKNWKRLTGALRIGFFLKPFSHHPGKCSSLTGMAVCSIYKQLALLRAAQAVRPFWATQLRNQKFTFFFFSYTSSQELEFCLLSRRVLLYIHVVY